ncbi:MAG: hypothetical protein HQL97_01605 [Magnetococcales bacterium]|nr:hypothetical protein [Magnetococcales bacterium]MBF0260518.1 hypothetical protein [Magnetococcales bacterium]
MKQRINETLHKIEQLGLSESEFKRILSRLSDTELSLLEQLTALHRLAESELRRVLAIVEKVHKQLIDTFRPDGMRPATLRAR